MLREKSEVMEATPRAQSEVLLPGDRLDQSEPSLGPKTPRDPLVIWGEKEE